MKKNLAITIGTILLSMAATTVMAAGGGNGATLFKQHCAACHPDGGNIINPKHTLHKKSLNQRGIRNWSAIVKTMRKPGTGMTAFDAQTISDKDARAIAEYVLNTFK